MLLEIFRGEFGDSFLNIELLGRRVFSESNVEAGRSILRLGATKPWAACASKRAKIGAFLFMFLICELLLFVN